MAKKILNGLDLSSQRLINLADPTSGTDATTKQYVDALVQGISWKGTVRAATTATGTLATAYANGSVIDGVTLATGNRILLKDQSTAAENGIYTVNGSGAPTRATDADAGAELVNAAVFVSEGTVNADRAYVQTVNAAITVGTTGLTFTQFGGGQTYTAGNGLQLSTNSFSILLDTSSGLSVSGTGIKIDTTVVARKYAASIGNGSLTSIAVTHNLGTTDVHVAVKDNSSLALVDTDIVITDTNNVTLAFATAPTTNQYRVVVIG